MLGSCSCFGTIVEGEADAALADLHESTAARTLHDTAPSVQRLNAGHIRYTKWRRKVMSAATADLYIPNRCHVLIVRALMRRNCLWGAPGTASSVLHLSPAAYGYHQYPGFPRTSHSQRKSCARSGRLLASYPARRRRVLAMRHMGLSDRECGKPLRRKTVTHVSGINRHLCDRHGDIDNWRARLDSNQ